MNSGVFPARAGMSPVAQNHAPIFGRVPRASGDEPRAMVQNQLRAMCSPRERG